MADVGDASRVSHISEELARKALSVMMEMVENAIDPMKLSSDDVDIILVGGGSIILADDISGAKTVFKPAYFSIANAIGSAISKVSGTYERLVNYEEISREEAIAAAKKVAAEIAVNSGAVKETVEIIDVEDVPLQYYPGNTCRLKIKAAGELA